MSIEKISKDAIEACYDYIEKTMGGDTYVGFEERAWDQADIIAAAIREAGEPLAAALRCALATMDATAATSGFHQCGIARDLCRNALAEWEAK